MACLSTNLCVWDRVGIQAWCILGRRKVKHSTNYGSIPNLTSQAFASHHIAANATNRPSPTPFTVLAYPGQLYHENLPLQHSAVSFILPRVKAEICEGEYFSPRASTHASPLPPSTMLKGTIFLSFATAASLLRRPIRRLTPKTVFSGLVTAWRFAGWPTRRSSSVNATIEGVVRAPSAFSITRGCDPSMIATQELVVPRSMPITLLILFDPFSQ